MSCKCGSNCGCGSGCNCNNMYPTLGYLEKPSNEKIILGVAPAKMTFEKTEMSFTEGGNGCKCGSSCSCDPCNC